MSERTRLAITIAVAAASAALAPRDGAANEVTLEIPAEPPGGPLRRRVQQMLPPHVGCAVLVLGYDATGEPIDFREGYGRTGLSGDAADVTPRTNFRMGSFSKVITALAVLRLADAGKLSLDDPATRWLVGMPDWGERCTVRSMLDHTSGMPIYHGLLRSFGTVLGTQVPVRYSDLNVFHAVTNAQPLFPPRASCDYSNSAYVLLGLVAQQATGDPMHVAIREWALRPAGMGGSEVLVPALNGVAHRAYGHRPGPINARNAAMVEALQRQVAQMQQMRNRPNLPAAQLEAFDTQIERLEARLAAITPPPGEANADWHLEDQSEYSELGGDGALYTSIDDLRSLIRTVFDRESLLTDKSWDLWTAAQTTPAAGDRFRDSDAERRYAYGWMIDERTGEPRLSHRGETRGFRQTVQVYPGSGKAVAVLMNSTPTDPQTGSDWNDARFEELGEKLLQAVLRPTVTESTDKEATEVIEDTIEPIELNRVNEG